MKWNDIDQQVCSVARALSVVGERWTLLIVRDAFQGTRRFDDFQRSLGVTRHRLSERLSRLVDDGVMRKVAYRQKPVRYEYRLTRKGLALYPILVSLSHWGDEWLDDGSGPPLRYWHSRCGKVMAPVMSCSECGDTLKPEEVSAKLGSRLTAFVKARREAGEEIPPDSALAMEAMRFTPGGSEPESGHHSAPPEVIDD
ncbi:winged helix-turn-helix transcriptional regulator [Luminiphilus syltensis]|nr:helix-turn-helix domain-containing protein [Luminiphilus syltensis]